MDGSILKGTINYEIVYFMNNNCGSIIWRMPVHANIKLYKLQIKTVVHATNDDYTCMKNCLILVMILRVYAGYLHCKLLYPL